MPYQTARVPITLKGTTVFETVAVAPAHQLNTKVLLSTPVNKITTEHLLDSYLSKQQQKQKQAKENKLVNQVKTHNLRNKKPVKYFPEEEESIYEDDRASDLSYNTDSETDTVSSSETTDRKNNHSDEEHRLISTFILPLFLPALITPPTKPLLPQSLIAQPILLSKQAQPLP